MKHLDEINDFKVLLWLIKRLIEAYGRKSTIRWLKETIEELTHDKKDS